MNILLNGLNKTVLAAVLLSAATLPAQLPDTLRVDHGGITTPVMTDADDAALWIHPALPESSIVIGTDKGPQASGGLYVWNMNGSLRQMIPLSRPNNVDVRSGLRAGAASMDIAAVTIRGRDIMRVYKIDPVTRMLTDVTAPAGIAVFDEPYGLALHRRSRDGFIFAFMSSKSEDHLREIWQIRLHADSTGQVKGTKVRSFGEHQGVVEGMVADDELGFFYCAEGKAGIHKYYADPQKGSQRLAFFATDSMPSWDRKGLALYKCANGAGYLLVASPEDRSIKVYPRAGGHMGIHHHPLLAVILNTAGKYGVAVEATSLPTSKRFPFGVLIWHDEPARRFRLYAWDEVAQGVLQVCPPVMTQVHSPAAAGHGEALALRLRPNYPNPFNPRTVIAFELAEAGVVRLSIYNVVGKRIRTLVNEKLAPGMHTVFWDGNDEQQKAAPGGVYFCRAEHGALVQTRKLTLLR